MQTTDSSHASRTLWVDGLRGLAALIVTFYHLTAGEIPVLYKSYWVGTDRHFVQLPPFRIIVAGEAMVKLFFVLSGYSISMRLVQTRQNDSQLAFYRRLASAVLRRGPRLYLPVIFTMLLSHLVFYLGLYDFPFNEPREGCVGSRPFESPVPHLQCLAASALTWLGFGESGGPVGLTSQLWTIPQEFHASLQTYGLLFAFAAEHRRALGLFGCAVILFLAGRLIAFAFICGLILSELDQWKVQEKNSILDIGHGTRRFVKWNGTFDVIGALSLFSCGIWLYCLPYDESFPPDYDFQTAFTWTEWYDAETVIGSWHVLGAVFVVSSTRGLPQLQKLLSGPGFRF